jgi:hypothetical protein
MAVTVQLGDNFERGPARELFKFTVISGGPRAFSFHYDVAADGRFLAITRPKDEVVERAAITVVLNWQAGLKK